MYVFADVDVYLNSLADTEVYTTLPLETREKRVFTAYDRLTTFYSEALLTPKIIGLQTLYMLKGGETQALTDIRAAGAESYSIDGVSVTFADGLTGISPEVEAIISTLMPKTFVGRLI